MGGLAIIYETGFPNLRVGITAEIAAMSNRRRVGFEIAGDLGI